MKPAHSTTKWNGRGLGSVATSAAATAAPVRAEHAIKRPCFVRACVRVANDSSHPAVRSKGDGSFAAIQCVPTLFRRATSTCECCSRAALNHVRCLHAELERREVFEFLCS